ncbi:MAG: alpha/beta hydrolase [Chloroflexota bacterium]
MAFVNTDGGRIYYEIEGKGPVVVLGHAGFVDSRMWDTQWEAFTQHYTVLRYDMQGNGQSDRASGPLSRRSELLNLLQQLGIKHAHLIGSSLSGATFIDFAIEHPEMVSSLVTINAVPNGFEMQGEPPRYMLEMLQALQQGNFDRATELQIRIWIDGMYREPAEINSAVRQQATEMNRAPVQNNTWLIADSQPLNPLDPAAVDRLHEITCPVLVIDGALDHPEVRRAVKTMAATIEHAQQVTIDDTAHMPSMENPAEFNRIVLTYLANL